MVLTLRMSHDNSLAPVTFSTTMTLTNTPVCVALNAQQKLEAMKFDAAM